jgi:hypothetical protein
MAVTLPDRLKAHEGAANAELADVSPDAKGGLLVLILMRRLMNRRAYAPELAQDVAVESLKALPVRPARAR